MPARSPAQSLFGTFQLGSTCLSLDRIEAGGCLPSRLADGDGIALDRFQVLKER